MSKKKKLDELITTNEDNALELVNANKEVASKKDEKGEKLSELIIANQENALALITANKLIATQNQEINKRESELIHANKELAHQAELIILNKKLALANKQEKLAKEKAEKSDCLKSAFLTNMSHEIRTPMNGILGFAGLLKEPNLTGEEQQDYIRIIEKSGARMLNIINDIVDISKIEAGLMEVHYKESNINEQLEYIYTFFKPEVEGKGIKFFLKSGLPTKEAVIRTDREKLFAILTNLVKNAIKYSFGGTIEFGYKSVGMTGQVTVETHCSASLQPPTSKQPPVVLQFYVRDNGIGIPKDRQEAIFERFIQADIGDKQAFQGAG